MVSTIMPSMQAAAIMPRPVLSAFMSLAFQLPGRRPEDLTSISAA